MVCFRRDHSQYEEECISQYVYVGMHVFREPFLVGGVLVSQAGPALHPVGRRPPKPTLFLILEEGLRLVPMLCMGMHVKDALRRGLGRYMRVFGTQSVPAMGPQAELGNQKIIGCFGIGRQRHDERLLDPVLQRDDVFFQG